MNKICKRCQQSFNCNVEKIEDCGCSDFQLSEETKTYLAKTSYDCLCSKCLEEINHFEQLKKEYPFPQHPSQYKEGIHYYIDGPYWVFTTYFHYLKGNCCKNNCRHCAYGFQPNS